MMIDLRITKFTCKQMKLFLYFSNLSMKTDKPYVLASRADLKKIKRTGNLTWVQKRTNKWNRTEKISQQEYNSDDGRVGVEKMTLASCCQKIQCQSFRRGNVQSSIIATNQRRQNCCNKSLTGHTHHVATCKQENGWGGAEKRREESRL